MVIATTKPKYEGNNNGVPNYEGVYDGEYELSITLRPSLPPAFSTKGL